MIFTFGCYNVESNNSLSVHDDTYKENDLYSHYKGPKGLYMPDSISSRNVSSLEFDGNKLIVRNRQLAPTIFDYEFRDNQLLIKYENDKYWFKFEDIYNCKFLYNADTDEIVIVFMDANKILGVKVTFYGLKENVKDLEENKEQEAVNYIYDGNHEAFIMSRAGTAKINEIQSVSIAIEPAIGEFNWKSPFYIDVCFEDVKKLGFGRFYEFTLLRMSDSIYRMFNIKEIPMFPHLKTDKHILVIYPKNDRTNYSNWKVFERLDSGSFRFIGGGCSYFNRDAIIREAAKRYYINIDEYVHENTR